MKPYEQELHRIAQIIDVKSFEIGLNYSQKLVKALVDKTLGSQVVGDVMEVVKKSIDYDYEALPTEEATAIITAAVVKAALNNLTDVLERDSKWTIDKLMQYSEGVSDAHVSKLAAAMKGQYQNHNLAPRKNGSAADDDTK